MRPQVYAYNFGLKFNFDNKLGCQIEATKIEVGPIVLKLLLV